MIAPYQSLLDDAFLRDAPTIMGYKVLDPVVLYALIAEGGMSRVYRGRHLKFDMDVAVKCLRSDPDVGADEMLSRFWREARMAADISHQNLVRVMDVGDVAGVHYQVMEFVRGESLRHRVRRRGPLPADEAITILAGMTRGLEAAHRRGIVHRDIKPDNVLIAIDGEVKVADLGLGRSQNIAHDSLPSQHAMGTPHYMPPEQWESLSKATTSSDVWALGATLFFMLAGRDAAGGGSYAEVCRSICNGGLARLREIRPDLPHQIVALVDRCMCPTAGDRPPNATALLALLAPFPHTSASEIAACTIAATDAVDAQATPPATTLLRIRSELGRRIDLQRTRVVDSSVSDAVATNQIRTLATVPTRQRSGRRLARVSATLGLIGCITAAVVWTALDASVDAVVDGQRRLAVADYRGAREALAAAERAGRDVGRLLAAVDRAEATDLATGHPWRAYPLACAAAERSSEHEPFRAELATRLQAEVAVSVRLDVPSRWLRLDQLVRLLSRHASVRRVRFAVVPVGRQPDSFTDGNPVGGAFAADLVAAGDGEHVVHARLELDHELVCELTAAVTVAATPPCVELLEPSPGATIGTRATVRGTVRGNGISEVGIGALSFDVVDGAFEAPLTLPADCTSISVAAMDVDGRPAKCERRVVVDAIAPSFVDVSPPARYVTAARRVILRARLDDVAATVCLDETTVPSPGGELELEVQLGIGEERVLELVAVDSVGNRQSHVWNLVHDDVDPVLQWETAPPDRATGAVRLAGRVVEVHLASLELNDMMDVPVTDGEWSVTIQVDDTVGRDIRIVAVDEAGNDFELTHRFGPTPANPGATSSPAAPSTDATSIRPVIRVPAWGTAIDDEVVSVGGIDYPVRMRDTLRDCVMVFVQGPDGPLYLDETEATWKQWRRFVAATPGAANPPTSEHRGQRIGSDDHFPVYNVSYEAVVRFLAWGGAELRLPTGAEWQVGLLGSAPARRFPWGDDKTVPQDSANYHAPRDRYPTTAPVRSFAPTNGLFDLAGNVWEMTSQFVDGNSIECRGGAWSTASVEQREVRGSLAITATEAREDVGFRCARSLD